MSEMELNKNRNLISKRHSCSFLAPNSATRKDTSQQKQLDELTYGFSKNTYDIKNNKYPKLTIGMFFEFMRTAYQVNDSFEGLAAILSNKSEINWNKLAKINLNLDISIDNKNPANDSQLHKNLPNELESPNNEMSDLTEALNTCTNEKIDFYTPEIMHNTADDNNQLILTTNQYTKEIKPLQSIHDQSIVCLQTINYTEKQDYLQNSKSKENDIKDRNHLSEHILHVEPSKSKQHIEEKEPILTKILRKNLSDILHEGLLDSILPYMLPKPAISQPVIKKSIVNINIKRSTSLSNDIDNGIINNLSISKDKDKNKQVKKAADMTEVEIHVCDEGKNMKKDFRCPQKLLIQKMHYFADITAGQKLEEIDISVHCDIVIFDWLMRWVKKDITKKSEWPILEASNVIPIMVSASFLQMEPLLENCFQYCHDNMSDILKTSTILTCLNDNLLTRLAKLFTNEDVENLQDKKDKIQSRLFCKLIMSLIEINPDNKKGHYGSLATLFKCGKCNKNVVQSISDFIPCISTAMQIDNKGTIHNKHIRDSTWSLNEYITNLRMELRSWRKVYWRLWGDCHFLFCQYCNTYFSIHQMGWCCYHPECPQFFVNEHQRPMSFPLGRYPCCSQRAYKFEVLPNQQGCKYKEHLPNIKTENDMNILNIFITYRDIISIEPPQLFFPEKITRLVTHDSSNQPGKLICKETMWWNGLELVPSRLQLGLLGKIWNGSVIHKSTQVIDLEKPLQKDYRQITGRSSTSSSVTFSDDDEIEMNDDDNTDNESYDSEESSVWSSLKTIKKTNKKSKATTIKRENGKCWSTSLMVRYNQDNQRDFEERINAQMISLLTKRTSIEHILLSKSYNRQRSQIYKNILPIGGSYMKLEAEFRDQWAQTYKNSSTGKNTMRLKKQ
ncbi:uncharacterized protein KIAA1841 homolog [Vespa mandarinia]|uniref:uncharacterized protein KIAA1841 homolog n=1 Tax=Vespa mandarinia TaxID=7446 RepID=UPI00161AC7CB|nr:uncharacterized protein KIAA1841 homolog [Vespa mandarinia]